MKLHYLLPVLKDRCPVCNAYTEHNNGTIDMPIPLGPITDPIETVVGPASNIIQTEEVSVTHCRVCGWAIRY